MTNPLLPQAIAALLNEHKYYTESKIQYLFDASSDKLKGFSERPLEALAFECHKALCSLSFQGECRVDALKGITYIYPLDAGLNKVWMGSGKAHKSAIFAAVLDWYAKEVGK